MSDAPPTARRRGPTLAVTMALVLTACGPSAAVPSSSPAPSATFTATPARTASPSPSPSPTPAGAPAGSITAIEVLTEIVGWVGVRGSGGASLAKTSDGGRTWTRVGPARIAGIDSLDELRFVDERRGFAIGSSTGPNGRSVVLVTADGGTTWTERHMIAAADSAGRPSPLRGLVVIDDRHAWVIATPGPCDPAGCVTELRATADAGATWQTAYRPTGAELRDVGFADVASGWLLSAYAVRLGGEVLRTADGGRTWTATSHNTATVNYLGISGPTPLDVWALFFDVASCTAGGCARYGLQASHDGGLTWIPVHAAEDDQDWRVKPGCGGLLGPPTLLDANRGVIPLGQGAGGVGNPGGLLLTEDGGGTFRCVRVTTENSSIAVRFANAKVGWAQATTIDQSIWLYRSLDGGASWQRMSSP